MEDITKELQGIADRLEEEGKAVLTICELGRDSYNVNISASADKLTGMILSFMFSNPAALAAVCVAVDKIKGCKLPAFDDMKKNIDEVINGKGELQVSATDADEIKLTPKQDS